MLCCACVRGEDQMIGSLTVTIPSPWNNQHRYLRPTPPLIKCESGGVPLTKQGHRFLSSLAATAGVSDPAAASRLIKKFVASSPKSIALNALSHLLSPRNSHPHLSALAFPVRPSSPLSLSSKHFYRNSDSLFCLVNSYTLR